MALMMETVTERMMPPPDLHKMSPSNSSPTTSPTGPSVSASRRPPRKSTLTQQQKNQKRQRATQDQLTTLEVEFNKNPTPTAAVRERIAQEINMTERSVQIWFQNRRAKIKTLAKKSIETGEDCDAIPDSMRKYLALQALESGRQVPHDAFNTASINGYSPSLFMNTESNASKVAIQHFNCQFLSIGSWRRVGQAALDLVVFYAPEKSWVTYYINSDSHGFRIEYPFSYIKNINLDNGDASANAEGGPNRSGGLVVELNRSPHFSMDPGSGGFFECRDFTEDHQASNVLRHHLGGHPKVLSGQLAKLVSLESFRNRHRPTELANPPPPPDPVPMIMGPPMSPPNHRPASQPNHMVHPHAHPIQHDHFGMPLQGGPPRGHKRQRSRSVPVAIDFSHFRHPYPPFLNHHTPAEVNTPPLFAPIPQHAAMPQLQPTSGPIAPRLSIDPSAGYSLEYRPGTMSATTANSPSEYDPPFFTSGAPSENFATTNLNTPYGLPFLSPMVDPSSVVQPSVSPLSAISHQDPIIANQSPPLNSLDRSASAEIYPVSHDGAMFGDEAFNFNEMYSGKPFTLPFRSPLVEHTNDEFDFNSMVHFGTVDPPSLSPDDGSGFQSHP